MEGKRKQLLDRVAIVYGESSDIAKGFKALCERSDISDAHLEVIAWYMHCSSTKIRKIKS